MTRTIKQTANRFSVIYRGAVEITFGTKGEAEAYIRAGVFPSPFVRRGPSPFRRT